MDGKRGRWAELLTSEDWWAVWLGFLLIVAGAFGLTGVIPKIGGWETNPLAAMQLTDAGGAVTGTIWLSWLLLLLALGVLCTVAVAAIRRRVGLYPLGFIGVYLLASVSCVLANQSRVEAYGLGYAFWALLLGLLISNTAGTPRWLLHGARSEMYIKTGLVLLGAEILFGKILDLGGPGCWSRGWSRRSSSCSCTTSACAC